ncbi:MAG: hypothetical protein ACP5OU_09040 [Methanothrix sp.]
MIYIKLSSRRPACEDADLGGLAPSCLQDVFGLDSKAVHGGAGEAGDINGGEDLFREDSASGLVERNAGGAGGWEML